MIPFNKPFFNQDVLKNLEQVFLNDKLCGDGIFTKKCSIWMENNFFCKKALLTTSCTHALEIAALLCDIQSGDEVILPSYTFCSTADAFVQRGASLVFIDIRKDTMNIDEMKIEAAITEKTKVIVPVHYAGVSCEMDVILNIARKYNLFVVEDAAQGVMGSYKGKALGTLGDFGCYSFHETKNYSMGEGGALIINNEKYIEKAEIIREKGTNRSKFFRGQIDKYTWVDYGSSYLPSDLNAAYLWSQFEIADIINDRRLKIWKNYFDGLQDLQRYGYLSLPCIPEYCVHNAHMFYIKTKDLEERTSLIEFLKKNDILSVFHYVPLHSSPAGVKFGLLHGKDENTTIESNRLLRLPIWYGITDDEITKIIDVIRIYYGK